MNSAAGASFEVSGGRFDIVKEGFARACSSPFRADLENDIVWQLRSPGVVETSRVGAPSPGLTAASSPCMGFAENDQAHKGF